MANGNRVKVLNAIRESSEGATTSELQASTGLSYPTLLKWLEVLNVEGLTRYRKVGKSHLWFASEVIDRLSEKEIDRMLKLRKLAGVLGQQAPQAEAVNDFLFRLARGAAKLKW